MRAHKYTKVTKVSWLYTIHIGLTYQCIQYNGCFLQIIAGRLLHAKLYMTTNAVVRVNMATGEYEHACLLGSCDRARGNASTTNTCRVSNHARPGWIRAGLNQQHIYTAHATQLLHVWFHPPSARIAACSQRSQVVKHD